MRLEKRYVLFVVMFAGILGMIPITSVQLQSLEGMKFQCAVREGTLKAVMQEATGSVSVLAAEHADVITVGTTYGVENCLDPALEHSYSGWDIMTSLSSGLVDIEPGLDNVSDYIVPALATSWTCGGGGLIWDFQLRTDVTYDGVRPFNASCVKYTFDRNCNLTGNGLAELDGPQVSMGYSDIIKNVTTLGTYAVRFNLKIPFAPFLQLISCAASYMVDPIRAPMNSLVLYTEGNPNASSACGLGPYQLEMWTRFGGTDQEIWLHKNPNYWNITGGFPVTERIIIKVFSDDVVLDSAINLGQIDVAYRGLVPPEVATFKTNPNINVWEGHGAQIQYICFQQRIAPFDNANVRKAIAACLNRTNLCVTAFLATAEPLYSFIPNGVAYHKDAFAIYGSANYTYAQSLLTPLGYNSTNELTVDIWYESSGHYPLSYEQALICESDLEASGVIRVNLHAADWGSYRELRDNASMPVFLYGRTGYLADADEYASLPFANWLNMGFNSTYGGVTQYNYWVGGRNATTYIDRYANYSALQDLQAYDCSMVPLWQSHNTVVAGLDVNGVSPDITERLYFWRLYVELSVFPFDISLILWFFISAAVVVTPVFLLIRVKRFGSRETGL